MYNTLFFSFQSWKYILENQTIEVININRHVKEWQGYSNAKCLTTFNSFQIASNVWWIQTINFSTSAGLIKVKSFLCFLAFVRCITTTESLVLTFMNASIYYKQLSFIRHFVFLNPLFFDTHVI